MYARSPVGIACEVYSFGAGDMTCTNPAALQRPETIESLYYLAYFAGQDAARLERTIKAKEAEVAKAGVTPALLTKMQSTIRALRTENLKLRAKQARYRKWGYAIFLAVRTHSRGPHGYTQLRVPSNVEHEARVPSVALELFANKADGHNQESNSATVAGRQKVVSPPSHVVPQIDKQETFVAAEMFKYLYLLLSPNTERLVDLDRMVFNTEAHPLLRSAVIV